MANEVLKLTEFYKDGTTGRMYLYLRKIGKELRVNLKINRRLVAWQINNNFL